MATDVVATIKLQLDAGDASLLKLAQNLGPTGASPVQIKLAFDEATADQRGLTIPVVVTVHADRSFALEVRTPQTAALLRQAADAAERIVAGTARSMGLEVVD